MDGKKRMSWKRWTREVEVLKSSEGLAVVTSREGFDKQDETNKTDVGKGRSHAAFLFFLAKPLSHQDTPAMSTKRLFEITFHSDLQLVR